MVVAQAEPIDAERRRAEMAEDQDPVEGGVHQVADDDRDHDRRGAMHGLEALPEHHEEEERQHAGREAHRIRGRRRDHVGRLARQQHERLGEEQQDAWREWRA